MVGIACLCGIEACMSVSLMWLDLVQKAHNMAKTSSSYFKRVEAAVKIFSVLFASICGLALVFLHQSVTVFVTLLIFVVIITTYYKIGRQIAAVLAMFSGRSSTKSSSKKAGDGTVYVSGKPTRSPAETVVLVANRVCGVLSLYIAAAVAWVMTSYPAINATKSETDVLNIASIAILAVMITTLTTTIHVIVKYVKVGSWKLFARTTKRVASGITIASKSGASTTSSVVAKSEGTSAVSQSGASGSTLSVSGDDCGTENNASSAISS